MRDEKIYLPTLKRVKISNYSLFRKDIDYEFILGLNLIIGGNGIGKTTFINIVKYALIGLYKKDLDVRVYKGEKRLIRGNYANCNTFFRNRTEEKDSDKDGSVELWFDINETSFYVKRSLFDVKIEKAIYIKDDKEYIIGGVASKQDLYKGYDYYNDKNDNTSLQYNYERIVSEASNLSDFEDLIFFVNQILFFGESRENVLWSRSVQERLLSSFLNDSSLERKRKEYTLEAKYQDSISRHKQEEIKAITRVLKQINENKDVKYDQLTVMKEIEHYEALKVQLENDRDNCQKKVYSLYNKDSQLTKKINEKEKEKQKLDAELKRNFWPNLNPKYEIYLRQYKGNHICPMCNSDLSDRVYEEKNDECFFCHSKIICNPSQLNDVEAVTSELSLLEEKRMTIEKNILLYENELKDIDSKYRKNKVDLFNEQSKLRFFEKANDQNDDKQESSYLAMINRINELTIEKEKAVELSEKNRNNALMIIRKIQENLFEITKSISNIFSVFAENFMKLSCYLTLENINNSDVKLFFPVIDNKIRYESEELSESQRFFVDYSFRMSILSYFYEMPSFYICETPDSSLDISYEENAAEIFMKYLEKPNSLILTSNLNNSTFITQILKRAKNRKILNLLKYGKLSLVQKNHDILKKLSDEIEEEYNG